jgi:hypothetical protein
MVDTPNKQSFPPAVTPGVERKPKVEPMELATSAPYNKKYNGPNQSADPDSGSKDLANKDHDAKFTMPDKVTQSQIRDQSFKYGGGRSAGNRSLKANQDLKAKQP